jgi:hypothetical protein
MGGNYKRPHRSEPRQARHSHHFPLPASQSLAASHDLVNTSNTEDIVTPEFHIPLNGTYPSQLEIQEDKDTPISSSTAILEPTVMDTDQEATTAASTSWIATQERNFNDENKISYIPITRPWEEQLPNQQGTKSAYSDQTQTPLAVWESQAPVEEPFSNIGEVAIKPTYRQQDEPSHQAGKL